MFEREIRDFSTVPRWTTLRTVQKQNVAEHTFYVIMYARQIVKFLRLSDLILLIVMDQALWHDSEETFSGDTPGPWKRLSEDPDKASLAARRILAARFSDLPIMLPAQWLPIVKSVIKIANMVDELMFLSNDFQMGNKNVTGVMANTVARIEEYVMTMPDPVTGDQKTELLTMIRTAQQRHMFDLSNYLVG